MGVIKKDSEQTAQKSDISYNAKMSGCAAGHSVYEIRRIKNE
jgi:hypothetical protein